MIHLIDRESEGEHKVRELDDLREMLTRSRERAERVKVREQSGRRVDLSNNAYSSVI